MIENIKVKPEMNTGSTKPAQDRRFNILLLVLLGLMLGVIAAYLISQGNWVIAAAVVIMIPSTVLLNEQPFLGVILWLLVMPFVSVFPRSDLAYWVFYRILPLALLGLAVLSRILKVRTHPPVRIGPPELAMGLLAMMVPAFIIFFQTDPSMALIRFGDRIILPFCMYMVVRLTAPRKNEFTQLVMGGSFYRLEPVYHWLFILGCAAGITPDLALFEWSTNYRFSERPRLVCCSYSPSALSC